MHPALESEKLHRIDYVLHPLLGVDIAVDVVAVADGTVRIWSRSWTGVAPRKGDINGDGKITLRYATIALQIVIGSRPYDEVADVSGNGSATALDALMILQAGAGSIEIG